MSRPPSKRSQSQDSLRRRSSPSSDRTKNKVSRDALPLTGSNQSEEIGLGTADTQTGDVLAVLAGGNVPYVLRHNREFKFDEAQRYFVGECYVNGKMHGRVGMDKHLSPAKDIFLH